MHVLMPDTVSGTQDTRTFCTGSDVTDGIFGQFAHPLAFSTDQRSMRSSVSEVILLRVVAQVFNAVVKAVAIVMADVHAFWWRANEGTRHENMDITPDNSLFVKGDGYVTQMRIYSYERWSHEPSSDIALDARLVLMPRAHSSGKRTYPSKGGYVVETFPSNDGTPLFSSCGNVGFSHIAPRMRCGEGGGNRVSPVPSPAILPQPVIL